MPFQLGNPGGPGHKAGTPSRRKRPITDRYIEGLDLAMPAHVCKALKVKTGTTWGEGVALAALMAAVQPIKGTQARKDIREAIEGKAPQRIEMATIEDKQVEIVVTYDALPVRGSDESKIIDAAVGNEIAEVIRETLSEDEEPPSGV